MNCQTCRDLLQRRLDGEPLEDASLDWHLRNCSDCRGLYAAAARLHAGVLRLASSAPPPYLAAQIVGRVVADRRARRRRRVALGLALAASALLALGLGRTWFGPAPVRLAPDAGDLAARPAPTDRADDAPDDSLAHTMPDPLRESVAEAGSAVRDLTGRTAADAVEQARALLPVVTGPMPNELLREPVLQGPAVSWDDARQGLKSGLEPVTSSARRAVGLFFRDLAPGEDAPGL